MGKIIAYGICSIIIIMAINESLSSLKYDKSLKYSRNRVLYYISILISFLIINSTLSLILSNIIEITSKYFNISSIRNEVIRMVLLIFIYFIMHFLIYSLLKFIFNLFSSKRQKSYKWMPFISAVFGIVKGIVVILIMFIAVIIFNLTVGRNITVNIFEDFSSYDYLENEICKNFYYTEGTLTADDDYEINIPTSNILVYYNGVTLEDGIESNSEIDKKANELVRYKEKDLDKAKSLYVWIGSNIDYDFKKAEQTLNNEGSTKSGAIEAWRTRKGICFDYACLYVAMARACGLKVRLVTGSAYDGIQYGPHAWNEVYLEDEERWIPVDATFYSAGNYFDNENFYVDHNIDSIAGEW